MNKRDILLLIAEVILLSSPAHHPKALVFAEDRGRSHEAKPPLKTYQSTLIYKAQSHIYRHSEGLSQSEEKLKDPNRFTDQYLTDAKVS